MEPAWTLQPWAESDATPISTLLDLVYADDPIARDTQAVHGASRDEPGAFSRSVVAVRTSYLTQAAPGRRVGARQALPSLGLASVGRASPAPMDGLQTRPRETGDGKLSAGAIIGVGTVDEAAFAPARWRLSLQVHPDHRRRGVGSALLRHLAAIAAARDTRSLQIGLRAGAHASLEFLTHRGFRHLMRTRLGTIAPIPIPTRAPLPPIASESLSGSARAVRPGRERAPSLHWRIAPLPSLTHIPDIATQIATLHTSIYRQTHAWSPPAPIITSKQAETAFLGPDLIPDALFVALADETPIGIASLRRGLTLGDIDLGWTGVLAGLATAAPALTATLLDRCLVYARARGWTVRIEVDEADHVLWRLINALPVANEPDWLNLERIPSSSSPPA